MRNLFIFGHKSPDTDSIVSSIVMADLVKKKENPDAKACRLGNINKETEFVLNYFGVEVPELLESVTCDDDVILVDHNSFSQSVDGIEKASIKKVVDHHCISEFSTKEPLFFNAQPVGCTATILYDFYYSNQLTIDKTIAGLMLSAIISDTLLLKSPTCTVKDIKIVEILAEIAEIDYKTYGIEMLKAGTDLSEFTPEELINIDSKFFTANNTNIQIAQVNTVSIDDVLKDKQEIEIAMNKYIDDKNLDLFMFTITDILNNNSQVIALGKRTDIVEKAYRITLEDNMCFLEGVVSRKKQMVPVISDNA